MRIFAAVHNSRIFMLSNIRPETAADRPGIYEINRLAFGQEAESRLIDLLRAGDSFIPELSLVALDAADRIIGHILLSRIHILSEQGHRHESLALAPMAVHPDYQKTGIGSQLIRQALADAAAMGFRSVIVLGDPGYYRRFGFTPAGQWQLQPPHAEWTEYFMALELMPGGLQEVSGKVVYPAAFETV